MSITSSTLLVELNISVWTANKLDKETTNKVTADNNAVAGSGQFRKNLDGWYKPKERDRRLCGRMSAVAQQQNFALV
jgi:hypothetical protein